MLRITLTVALSCTLVSACTKKEPDATGGGGGAKPVESAVPAAPAAPAQAAPRQMSAPDLFADYSKPGQDAMALIDKWRPGVIVTGAVTNTIGEETGALHVWLDGGAGAHVTLDFTDQGAGAKAKGVKSGDKITAQCQIGGADGKMMMLTDCAMK
jgi:hypothetical protein